MPDITMCINSACPLRGGCYRYLAVPSERDQSQAHFEPAYGSCDDRVAFGRGVVACTIDEADARNRHAE